MARGSGGPRRPALLAALLACVAAPVPAVPQAPYVLGVIPQAPPVAMHERWSPLVERLAAQAGVPLRLKVYDDMAEFERDFLEGGPDLLFAHPVMMAAAHVRQGYLPLVRDRRRLSALLFVREDSPVRTVRDLEGKGIAFVGGRNYCTILIESILSSGDQAIRFDGRRAGSSRNVVRAVMLGKAEAGAALDISLETEPAEVRQGLRTILASAPTASHPLAAHPRVPAEVRDRLSAAVLALARSEDGRALLARIRMSDPEPADYDRDYRALERLR